MRWLRPHLLGWVILSGAALPPLAARDVAMPPEAVTDATPRHLIINQILGLRASHLVSVVLSNDPAGDGVLATLSLDGLPATLHLRSHSVRSDAYQLQLGLPDGSRLTAPSGPLRTLRGIVEGHPGAVVAGSLGTAGLTARLLMADGRRLWLEPLAPLLATADPGEYVVYQDDDVTGSAGACRAVQDRAAQAALLNRRAFGAPFCTDGLCVAELACDADVEYFEHWGSIEAVEERINSVINAVNLQFERDVQISHLITTLVIRMSEPDPYDASDADALLSQFRLHWLVNHTEVPRDLAQLFTGRNLDGTTVGVAWVGSVCDNRAYSVVQSDWSSQFGCSTDLSAHEFGHNWGAIHCACPQHTMNPWIICANQFHPQFTIPDITGFRDTLECLNGVEPECGNQACEPSESPCSCPTDCGGCCLDDDCDDGIECTANGCDVAHGECLSVPLDEDCDNGLLCDGSEQCDPSIGCVPGIPVICDDGVDCTIDQCNEQAGGCTHLPDAARCDDDLSCNGAEICAADAGCLPGLPLDCDDGVDCTIDQCDEQAGGCTHLPDAARCDDDLSCNGAEICAADAGCLPGLPLDCDDGVDCTEDRCDDAAGCIHEPVDADCADGVFCNGSEWCDVLAGCQSAAGSPCDDGVACTVETCDEQAGRCMVLADHGTCDNGLFCDGPEQCDLLAGCLTGTPPCAEGLCDEQSQTCLCETEADCADLPDDCLTAVCDPETGICQTKAAAAETACDDGDPCSSGDRCADGICLGDALDCDDDDPCTADSCSDGVCQHDAVLGDLDGDQEPDCSDGCPQDPAKTAPGACGCGVPEGTCGVPFGGGSSGGGGGDSCVPSSCDDGDDCTADSCIAGACVHTPILCDDDDACTSDRCREGACDHEPLDCADQDACTIDQCQDGFCSHAPMDCDDGDGCTLDSCVDGACVGNPLDCDDGDPCTIDDCGAGACTHVAVACDDGDACTQDVCDPAAGGCLHQAFDCDADGDGVADVDDLCPQTAPAEVDAQGCSAAQRDPAPAGQEDPSQMPGADPDDLGQPGCGACQPQPLAMVLMLLGFLGLRRRCALNGNGRSSAADPRPRRRSG